MKNIKMRTKIDNNHFKEYCNKCKKETIFKYYHGLLGYESFNCSVCNSDINDLKGGTTSDEKTR